MGGVTILDADGQVRFGLRFGGSTVPLPKAVQSLLEVGQNRILLNLEGVAQIGASGMGELISAYIAVNESGGQIKLVHLSQKVRELMTSAKLATVFEIFEDESKAADSFKSEILVSARQSAFPT